MGIRHAVMFTWNDDVDAAHVDACAAALRALPAQIPEIRSYQLGRDVGLNEGNAQFAVTAEFDDEGGYLAYRDHPAHRAVIDNYIAGRVASRAAVQFRTDG